VRWGGDEVVEGHPHLPPTEVQARRARDVAGIEQRLGDAEWTEDLQGAGVHDEGTRGSRRLGPALDDADPGAVVVGLEGECQAGGAGAHHHHVGVGAAAGHGTGAAVRAGRHQAASPASMSAASDGSSRTASRSKPGSTARRIEPGSLTSASTWRRAPT
jgi:hypothetical protein